MTRTTESERPDGAAQRIRHWMVAECITDDNHLPREAARQDWGASRLRLQAELKRRTGSQRGYAQRREKTPAARCLSPFLNGLGWSARKGGQAPSAACVAGVAPRLDGACLPFRARTYGLS